MATPIENPSNAPALDDPRSHMSHLAQVVTRLPHFIFWKDRNSVYWGCNQLFAEIAGLSSPEEIIGKTDHDLPWAGEVADSYRKDDRRVIESGKPEYEIIEPLRRADGSLAWLVTNKIPLTDAAGNVIGILGTFEDITQHKDQADELQRFRTKLKQVISELEETNARLLKADLTKSQFLANMSHEIRTPMNGVIGMTSLLMDTPLTDEQHDYVEIIRTSGESLLTIINEILDFSKIEAGKLVLEQQEFDVNTCVSEALDLVSAAASAKGIELLYYIDPSVPPVVVSDITRLRQILVNLLSNAVKFTERGEILVSVTARLRENDRYRFEFEVKDTGIGIPADRVGVLFEAFSQVDASTTRKYGGTGLGLAISYQLSNLLGGDIRVESEPGRGSTFRLSIVAPASGEPAGNDMACLTGKRVLIVDDNATNRRILVELTRSRGMHPVAVTSGVEALAQINAGSGFDVALLDFHMPEMSGLALAQTLAHHAWASTLPLVMLSSIGERQADTDDLIPHWLTKPVKPDQLFRVLSSIFGETPRAGAKTVARLESDAPGRLSALRILLAEDNVINQKVATRMLERLDCRVDVVANGLEVLNALEQLRYDVILMDMMMPEMDGLEATRQIRSRPHAHQPYIIALTANAMEDDRKKCLAAGMDAYLSKPIRADQLEAALVHFSEIRLDQFAGSAVDASPT
ncbi:MAG: response regulator [Rhodothermales bacterium]